MNKRVGPRGAEEQSVLRERLLLFGCVAADVPKLGAHRRDICIGSADLEPMAPIGGRKTGLVEMIFDIKRDLRLGRVRAADGQIVLKTGGRLLGDRTWRIWRQRARLASIAQCIVNQAGALAAGPFEI